MHPSLLSSKNMSWETPSKIFDPLNKEFKFTLDAAASPDNAKVAKFYSEDSLSRPWHGRVWLNPPYGRDICKWVKKARLEVESGRAELVVLLIPVRTDTSYWQDHIFGRAEVRFLRGRIRFVGASSSAPFPSAVVIFRKKSSREEINGSFSQRIYPQ